MLLINVVANHDSVSENNTNTNILVEIRRKEGQKRYDSAIIMVVYKENNNNNNILIKIRRKEGKKRHDNVIIITVVYREKQVRQLSVHPPN